VEIAEKKFGTTADLSLINDTESLASKTILVDIATMFYKTFAKQAISINKSDYINLIVQPSQNQLAEKKKLIQLRYVSTQGAYFSKSLNLCLLPAGKDAKGQNLHL